MPEAYAEQVDANGRHVFRYMAPLYANEPCLQCHAVQGYEAGDVRGGISVSFDIERVHGRLRLNLVIILGLSVLCSGFLVGIIYYFTGRLMRRLEEASRTIRDMAIKDGLTSIYNRRHCLELFGVEFERCKRTGTPLACLLADLDHFKGVNDGHGHLAGDSVLREAADLLDTHIRPYDVLGRYGGEEFIIAAPECSPGEAMAMASRIVEGIRGHEFALGEGQGHIRLTISVGVSVLAPGDMGIEDMIARADDALYHAKRSGRDRASAEPC